MRTVREEIAADIARGLMRGHEPETVRMERDIRARRAREQANAARLRKRLGW